MEKKTNYCLHFGLVFPMIWVLINISAADGLKNIGRKRLGMPKLYDLNKKEGGR